MYVRSNPYFRRDIRYRYRSKLVEIIVELPDINSVGCLSCIICWSVRKISIHQTQLDTKASCPRCDQFTGYTQQKRWCTVIVLTCPFSGLKCLWTNIGLVIEDEKRELIPSQQRRRVNNGAVVIHKAVEASASNTEPYLCTASGPSPLSLLFSQGSGGRSEWL